MSSEISDALSALKSVDPAATSEQYLGKQYDLGLAWPHFQVGLGGLGLSSKDSKDVAAQVLELGGPPTPASFVGLYQASALIHRACAPEQKGEYLRRIFLGLDQWCQLFSEPDAGSDLANVSTRAVRVGDEWTVDGQKVWTSNARHANLGLLLARTDPAAPKHQGLTLFIVNMSSDGVEVRPLRQADGGSRFSEVFLTGVTLDDTARLGPEGAGWKLSMETLSTERDSASDIFVGPLANLLESWRLNQFSRSPSLRDAVTATLIDDLVLDISRTRQKLSTNTREKHVLSSIAKVAASEHLQRMSGILAEVVGADVLVCADYDEAEAEELQASSAKAKNFSSLSPHRFIVRSRAMSIEGGTNQIARNIIGERVLDLPKEPRVDKAKPWTETRR